MPPTPAVIKELYPVEIAGGITRSGNRLSLSDGVKSEFHFLKSRFEQGAVTQALFFTKDSDHSFAPTKIISMNSTVYSVVDSVQGDVLTNVCGKLTMIEIAQIIESLSYAVKALHDEGKLHLDIKPSNIFLFNKDSPESKRVALFDFDSVTSISELGTAKIVASEGWAPYEQINIQRERISFATDIYSIGAVFYYLMSDGKKVTEDLLAAIKRGQFSFIDDFTVLENKNSPRDGVIEWLSATLRREPSKRAQTINELPE
jgi:serine/threonine protein kinase